MNISCKIFNNCFHKICIKLSETYFVLISCYKYNPGYQSCFGKNIPLSNNLSEVTNFRSSHHRCFTKKLFLKILIYSQEKTCAGVFFNSCFKNGIFFNFSWKINKRKGVKCSWRFRGAAYPPPHIPNGAHGWILWKLRASAAIDKRTYL